MKTIILTAAVLVANLSSAFSQKKNHFEFEVDPVAYAFGGVSGHVAYIFKNQRIQLGYAQVTIPESYRSSEGYTESFKGFPLLKWDFFIAKEDASHGFFTGPTVNYVFSTYKSDTDETKAKGINVGIRGGYKFDLFKKDKALSGLYLTPWVGISYNVKAGEIKLDNQVHSIKSLSVFPTIHLGWSF